MSRRQRVRKIELAIPKLEKAILKISTRRLARILSKAIVDYSSSIESFATSSPSDRVLTFEFWAKILFGRINTIQQTADHLNLSQPAEFLLLLFVDQGLDQEHEHIDFTSFKYLVLKRFIRMEADLDSREDIDLLIKIAITLLTRQLSTENCRVLLYHMAGTDDPRGLIEFLASSDTRHPVSDPTEQASLPQDQPSSPPVRRESFGFIGQTATINPDSSSPHDDEVAALTGGMGAGAKRR